MFKKRIAKNNATDTANISSKITLPVLANFLIEATKEENKIKISATNLEVSIEFYIQGKIERNICFNDGFAIKLNFQKNKIIIFQIIMECFGETEIITYYMDDSFS